jgi:hypothetical protein
MRVTFYKNIKTKSGKCANGKEVFMSMKNDEICISRTYTYPLLTDHNHLIGSKMVAASRLYSQMNSAFLADLANYTKAFNAQRLPAKKLPLNVRNIFIKAVCKHPTPIASVDGSEGLVATLGENLSSWISAGFLPSVSGNHDFSADVR